MTGQFIMKLMDIRGNSLKGQSHHDLGLLENPMKVLVLVGNLLIVS